MGFDPFPRATTKAVTSSQDVPTPIFILGAPRSFTSLVCAMLGENPGAYGVPELNLFAAETLEELVLEMIDMRQIQMHGLLRTVAQLYSGEQTIASIEMARRWLFNRLDRSTREIYCELCRKVEPLRIIDKSPLYVSDSRFLDRIRAEFPRAFYIHLVRHPLTQGQSVMNISDGAIAILNRSVDFRADPPIVDPQILWLRVQTTILEFLADVPPDRQILVRGEDLLARPEIAYRELCAFVELPADGDAMAAMLRPDRSPYACLGPVGAHLGNDINFLNSPKFKPAKPRPASLSVPLPWRPDNAGFDPDVKEMAHFLGYS
jgi:hypothetical protein